MKKVKLYKSSEYLRIKIPKQFHNKIEPGDINLAIEDYVFPVFLAQTYVISLSKSLKRKLELEKYDHVYIEYDEIYDLIEVHLNKPHDFKPEGTI